MSKKDPAFMFYSDDFLIGTLDFDFFQRGLYITLLIFQHQKGWLKKENITKILDSGMTAELQRKSSGRIAEVLLKFTKNKSGKYTYYYNKRLDYEIKKRAEYSASRRKNAAGSAPKYPFDKNKSFLNNSNDFKKAYALHMGNGNGNIKGGSKGEKYSKKYILDLATVIECDLNKPELIYWFLSSEGNYFLNEDLVLEKLKLFAKQNPKYLIQKEKYIQEGAGTRLKNIIETKLMK